MSKIVLGEILKSRKPSDDQLTRIYNSEALFVQWIDDAKKDKKICLELASKYIAEQFHSILKGQTFYPVLFHFVDVKTINKQAVRDRTVNFFVNAFCR